MASKAIKIDGEKAAKASNTSMTRGPSKGSECLPLIELQNVDFGLGRERIK
ncbi:X8 domain-containing protein [Psidium guajava]|nr:X8 domain-containing protein [Psidium guajava]